MAHGSHIVAGFLTVDRSQPIKFTRRIVSMVLNGPMLYVCACVSVCECAYFCVFHVIADVLTSDAVQGYIQLAFTINSPGSFVSVDLIGTRDVDFYSFPIPGFFTIMTMYPA